LWKVASVAVLLMVLPMSLLLKVIRHIVPVMAAGKAVSVIILTYITRAILLLMSVPLAILMVLIIKNLANKENWQG
jgi:hypothetical protein